MKHNLNLMQVQLQVSGGTRSARLQPQASVSPDPGSGAADASAKEFLNQYTALRLRWGRVYVAHRYHSFIESFRSTIGIAFLPG